MEDRKTIKKHKLKARYKFLIIFILTVASLLLWSRYISTSGLIIKEYKITNNHLPIHFHGLKIVHFTDIHYGRTVNKEELHNVVKEINLLNSDVVIFTGDLFDRDIKLTEGMKKDIIKELSTIKALYGKYAVKGNHDYAFTSYEEVIKDSGFININNDYDIINNKYYEKILIGGLDSDIKGKPDISKINTFLSSELGKDIKYKILIMHTPDTYDKIKNNPFNLILSGHSHNGQIRLPFIGEIITPEGAKKYYEPYYKINNNDFYISGGIGTSNISFRLFNKPSFNFYRLVEK